MVQPAVSVDPTTGLKIFKTRAAKAYQIADVGLAVTADKSLGVLPELSPGTKFDEDAKAKYNAFTASRAGAVGFMDMEGEFAKYLEDVYSEPPVKRDGLTDECEIVIIGAGLAGLVLWHHLSKAGFKDVRICEKAGDVGGTWYWNRYPGVACDIESYVYMPLLDEMGYVPSMKFASGFEIQSYYQSIAEKSGFYDHALFHTTVTETRWDEKAKRWIVRTDRGDAMRARFVFLASGLLTSPKLAKIEGMESFKGEDFHTSRWRYDVDLKDKRIGIVGTGASAVQLVPEMAKIAKELYVFQRTPATVDIREQRETTKQEYERWANDPAWAKTRRDRFARLPPGRQGMKADDDYLEGKVELPPVSGKPSMDDMIQNDFLLMEQIRMRIDAIVKDPATAALLKPYHAWGCKRPTFHDDYLPSFNLPHVKLVDCAPQGVNRITENGVLHNGVEYPLDVIIYATGFEWMAKSTFNIIIGRDGLSLRDKYEPEGTKTFLGLHSHGYPNLFFVAGPQAGGKGTSNYLTAVELYVEYFVWMLQTMREKGAVTVDVRKDIEEDYVKHCADMERVMLPYRNGCHSYYDHHGQAKLGSLAYYGGPEWYRRLLAAQESMEPYIFEKASTQLEKV